MHPTSVTRRRQPSSGRIGASQRAAALLDALADAGEVGTNELARRTGAEVWYGRWDRYEQAYDADDANPSRHAREAE